MLQFSLPENSTDTIQTTYRVIDDHNQVFIGNITISITPVNDIPFLLQDRFEVASSRIILNLTELVVDPDQDTLSFQLTSLPSVGTLASMNSMNETTRTSDQLPIQLTTGILIYNRPDSELFIETFTINISDSETSTNFELFLSRSTSTSTSSSSDNTDLIVGTTVGLILFACCAVVASVMVIAYFLNKKKAQQFIEIPESIQVLKDVKVGEVIGSGAFGVVYKANWQGVDVALKSIKGSDIKEFENELSLLS